jgi:hypothetical protein
MSSVCDNEQVIDGDALLDAKNEYLRLARLLSEKEVCPLIFFVWFYCH